AFGILARHDLGLERLGSALALGGASLTARRFGAGGGLTRCHRDEIMEYNGWRMDSSETGLRISGIRVAEGETREIYIKVSESFLSGSIEIPVTVIRGRRPGPTAFVTAAVHGDEINGADIVRRLIFDV